MLKLLLQKNKSNQERNFLKAGFEDLYSRLNQSNKRVIDNAKQKCASSWLTSLLVSWLGYALNKQEFRDSIALRYDWTIDGIPKHCDCGAPTDIDHCLSCKLGGYVIFRHNQIRDSVADIMR